VRQQHQRRQPQPAAAKTPDPAAEGIVAEIRQRLRAAANPRAAQEWRRTLGEDVPCHGVPAQQAHGIAMDFVRRMRTNGLGIAIDVADPLWRGGVLEEGLVADEIVNAQGRHVGGGEFDRFDAWMENVTNVVNADGLATHLVSRAVAAKPSLVARLRDWAKSNNRFRRRAAVMSFTPMAREGRFLTDALGVAETVIADPDEDVQAGVGMLLLEAARLQPDRVVEFLKRVKDRVPPNVMRIATSKMQPAHVRALQGA